MSDWKYAVSFAEHTPMTAPLPLAGDLYENMEKAIALGFDGIEFHTREDFAFDYERIAASRCRISMLVTGRIFTEDRYNLLDSDASRAERCLEILKTYLDKAAKIGAGIVLGWAKGQAASDADAALHTLGERLQALNAYAGKVQAPIVIEALNRYETNILRTASETLHFIDKYALDHCFVHLDTFHMNIEETDPYEAIRICGDRLGYFHASDNTRRCPGGGQLDFDRLLSALDRIGYSGWIDVECIPGPDREATAGSAFCYLKSCERRLLSNQ